MDIQQEFGIIKDDVIKYRDLVNKELKQGSDEELLYKGTVLLMSKLIYKPDFLFIGINSGQGNYQLTGKKDDNAELKPQDGFCYLIAEKNGHDYRLAKQTREVFYNSKFKDSLINSVKTNYFFTCTAKENDLYKFNRIIKNKYKIDYNRLAQKWISELIRIIDPKVIICEGSASFNHVVRYCNSITKEENGVMKANLHGKIPVLGYKRIFSNILNKENVIDALNKIK